jgi:hypothetical protein
MIRKIIPVFTAAAISLGITFVVPVAITTVSSFTFVSEAQAFGFKSIKKAAKKVGRGVKNGGIGAKAFGGWAGSAVKQAGKRTVHHAKRGGKTFTRSTSGAGRIALGTAKAAGRTIDRRSSQACVALGSCQGTITRGVSPGTKVTVNRR